MRVALLLVVAGCAGCSSAVATPPPEQPQAAPVAAAPQQAAPAANAFPVPAFAPRSWTLVDSAGNTSTLTAGTCRLGHPHTFVSTGPVGFGPSHHCSKCGTGYYTPQFVGPAPGGIWRVSLPNSQSANTPGGTEVRVERFMAHGPSGSLSMANDGIYVVSLTPHP